MNHPRPNFTLVAMTLLSAGLLLAFPLSIQAQSQSGGQDGPGLRVHIDPRVELLSIIYRLAGFNEYNQGRIESYLAEVDEHFKPHVDHAVIAMAQRLRGLRGIGYDAVMALAIHLEPGFAVRPIALLEDESLQLYGDGRWTPELAEKFIDAARDFAEAAGFQAFFEDHRDLYELTENRMQALLDEHMHMEWFADFYGVQPTAPFTIVPSIINGPANYGPKYFDPQEGEQLYAIIGVWLSDAQGLPRFDTSVLGTIVHEFNHSFVNHVVEAHHDELTEAGALIEQAVGPAMARQAYGQWQTILHESVVRAAVVRYTRAYDTEAAALREIRDQEERSFLWTAPLEQLLGEYETQRETYPVFADFMPRIATFFNDYAPKLEEIIEERERKLEQTRPRVLVIDPAPGSEYVDPAITKIVITFDRPMKGGYQCMTNDRGEYPKGEVRWNANRTMFTMKVSLKPDTVYAFTLNTSNGGAFQSAADGTPLKMTEVWFKTAAK